MGGLGTWTVRDPDDAEMARVTHVSPRFSWLHHAPGCNVIEVDDRMPDSLRPVVFAVSAMLFGRLVAAA